MPSLPQTGSNWSEQDSSHPEHRTFNNEITSWFNRGLTWHLNPKWDAHFKRGHTVRFIFCSCFYPFFWGGDIFYICVVWQYVQHSSIFNAIRHYKNFKNIFSPNCFIIVDGILTCFPLSYEPHHMLWNYQHKDCCSYSLSYTYVAKQDAHIIKNHNVTHC